MAAFQTWISLTDLARSYGLSTIHCGRILERLGWRDRRGRPTTAALEAGAAQESCHKGQSRSSLWNREICGRELKTHGYKPMSRNQQIQQWTQLLEALQEGSPSINATAEQMAQDMPNDLVDDVNHQLASRGCSFRIPGRHLQDQARRRASAC